MTYYQALLLLGIPEDEREKFILQYDVEDMTTGSWIRLASVTVDYYGIPARVVFVRNRDGQREWLALLCTDLKISDEEVVRIYGMRWDIEVYFKVCKSFLRLAKEFQGRSYDMLVAQTTLVSFVILS